MSFLRLGTSLVPGILHQNLRVASSPAIISQSRCLTTTPIQYKALQNWDRPSISEIGVPTQSWQHVHDRNQKRYNVQLLAGMVIFGVSAFVAGATINLNPRPQHLIDQVKYKTVLEPSPEPEESAEEETPTSVDQGTQPVPVQNEKAEQKPGIPGVKVPDFVPYLLIGAGTASFAAFRAIKSRDPTAKILIVGDENRIPYMRPPLSKEMWFMDDNESKEQLRFKQWNGKERSLFYEPDAFYTPIDKLEESEKGGISVLSGQKVVRIDPDSQEAILECGVKIKFGKCLIATGGRPRSLPQLENIPEDLKSKVTLFRKVEDFQNLDKITQKASSVAVLGGGFLGSELAVALGNRHMRGGPEVVQIYQEAGNMAKVLPDYLSDWTTDKVKSEGVKVMPNSRIKSVTKTESGRLKVDLTNSQLETDHLIVAVGVEPDHSLANKSGLQVDKNLGGFLVDDQFEARPNIWVAGDAAAFLDPTLGRRRVEHHDHAVVSGRLAGENMTGANKAYTHQSMFWSDLGPDVGYEAIGIVDSKLPTVGVFAKATPSDTPKGIVSKTGEGVRSVSEEKADSQIKSVESSDTSAADGGNEDYGKGIIFYLRDDKIVGMVLWNVFNRMNIARRILKENKTYDDLTEVAKLFNIYAQE